ncbi:thymidylate synthase [Tersicoccus sp. Bi-70]|uniref:thymidylate synthase n=1 Tax=Tersicoccus sp. Bi-70 TaxID=1897634 RepID=UPI0009779AA1|nr:thymidylate synthase [Tersicoccus sp. Bi-70]
MPHALKAASLDDLLRECLTLLQREGDQLTSTRGSSTEIRGASLELTNPRARLSLSSNRGRLFSALGELTWYLAGTSDPKHILYYIADYGSKVGNYSGGYGPRLFGAGDQVPRVIRQLKRKPTTRQAVVQLFDRNDLDGDPRDVPCTCSLQFFVRNERVDLIVHMRSNDVIYGMPHDIFVFTFLQEIVARAVNCEIGTYTHLVGSLHIYDSNQQQASAFLEEGVMDNKAMPPMPFGDPMISVARLVKIEQALRLAEPIEYHSELASYWMQLADVLTGWRAFKENDRASLERIRTRLAGSIYEIYLSDKQFRLES